MPSKKTTPVKKNGSTVRAAPAKSERAKNQKRERTVTVPVAVDSARPRPRFEPHLTKRGMRITGSDYISTVVLPATATRGSNFINLPLNVTVASNRLAVLASLHEKYCFRRVTYHYFPALGSSYSGSVAIFIDKDAADPSAPGQDGLNHAFSSPTFKEIRVWDSGTSTYTNTDPQDFYYCNPTEDGDLRLSTQGMFYGKIMNTVLNPSGGAVPTGTSIGDIYITYDIELYDPTYEPVQTFAQQTSANNVAVTTTAGGGFTGTANPVVGGAVTFRSTADIHSPFPHFRINFDSIATSLTYLLSEFFVGVTGTAGFAETIIATPWFGNGSYGTPLSFSATTSVKDTTNNLTAANFILNLPNLQLDGYGMLDSVLGYIVTSTLSGITQYASRSLSLTKGPRS